MNEDYRFRVNVSKERCNRMPDEEYCRRLYKMRVGKELDLDNPKTFNEKLQWLKLHDRNPLYTELVDKAKVKEFVSEKLGYKYIIPTLKLVNSFDEIDFNEMPEQFVIKCTHDSGGIVICKDKKYFDYDEARKK